MAFRRGRLRIHACKHQIPFDEQNIYYVQGYFLWILQYFFLVLE